MKFSRITIAFMLHGIIFIICSYGLGGTIPFPAYVFRRSEAYAADTFHPPYGTVAPWFNKSKAISLDSGIALWT